jgi:hypothetical protein
MTIMKIAVDFNVQPVWFFGGCNIYLVIKEGQERTAILGWIFMHRNDNDYVI